MTEQEWKVAFAATLAGYVAVDDRPSLEEFHEWLTAEADGAFDMDDPLNADPVEEAHEAAYAIQIMG